jgi:ribosomal protein S8
MAKVIDIDCQCPTYNEVVFPRVDILSNNKDYYMNLDYQTRKKLLHVTMPKNFVFKDTPVENLKSLKKMFEDEYVSSIKTRFLENMFLTGSHFSKKLQEENSTVYHRIYSLLDEHIELVEKIRHLKKNKRERYRKNKKLRQRKEKQDWKMEYSTIRGVLPNKKEETFLNIRFPTKERVEEKRNFVQIEIVPRK